MNLEYFFMTSLLGLLEVIHMLILTLIEDTRPTNKIKTCASYRSQSKVAVTNIETHRGNHSLA